MDTIQPTKRIIGNGWEWLNYKNVGIDNLYFIFELAFYKGRLKYIDFHFQNDYRQIKENWNDWSETDELSKRKIYEEWLFDKIGPKRNFNWGKIAAYYEPRGGTSGIMLTYK